MWTLLSLDTTSGSFLDQYLGLLRYCINVSHLSGTWRANSLGGTWCNKFENQSTKWPPPPRRARARTHTRTQTFTYTHTHTHSLTHTHTRARNARNSPTISEKKDFFPKLYHNPLFVSLVFMKITTALWPIWRSYITKKKKRKKMRPLYRCSLNKLV